MKNRKMETAITVLTGVVFRGTTDVQPVAVLTQTRHALDALCQDGAHQVQAIAMPSTITIGVPVGMTEEMRNPKSDRSHVVL
ncbi:hypothetical protein QYH69_30445 [Paraburkholderia sp. SARCC-3016]|uniref:hypothetical protein n=1 Tax=Paraburkholderia sp. SARCC-3016 TaxID=3058611 RepID=UPI002809FF93|nr:hypothetical protein [Paraburkholderia sp. SARCC-3016]MDQ7981548.1 hypothetical protein [Paraburkholderia sp. SARCC-3016]